MSSQQQAAPVLSFPKLGINLSVFDHFIKQCGGENNLIDLTTTDVCEKYLKPITASSKLSYCEWFLSQQQQNNQSQFSPQPLIIFSDLSNSPHLHLHQTPPQTQEFEQTTHQETEQIQQIVQVEQTEEQPSLQQTFEIEEPLQSSIFIEQDQVNIIPTIIPISIPIVYES
eukprot:c21142_g1_i1.p1 GENE.c21142_g1_i1~~c21142_g1_i1.p1  ORF type:complete len:170 (-),score=77.39 c21142_g1_i1:37-546(-)